MKPLKTVRLSDQVIEALKELIDSEGFSLGDKFYSENELTKKLDVSRSSIREAVRILEVTGVVTVKHGKGIFIADPMKKELEAFKEWLINNETSIFEHFEVRLMIDPKAAGVAAVKADHEDIMHMEKACRDFEAVYNEGKTPALIKHDEEFHLAMAKSTKNRTLYYLMKTMTSSLSEGWVTSLHTPGRSEKTIKEHKVIFQAIKNKDPKAAEKAMRDHLDNALADIRASLG
ncbi:MAG: hypothetical protein B6241_02285 [Spirochaetaceae bacterium 4572_59]|nr:MAG: hypothetical protein B6241_02285 [Spirochaetaceae bacterium 4572_59]